MISPSETDLHEQAKNGTHTRLIELRGGLGAVPGVQLAGVHAGIKKRKPDLALVLFDKPQNCASVITTNEIKAAPLLVSESHIAASGTNMRAIVVNAGCANACTGERGERDARATARQAAALLGIEQTQVIVSSTGVIGVYLPMDRMARGLERAVKDLEKGMEAAYDAAEAIMTTDNEPKLASYAFYVGKTRYVVGGIAKGSGMIAPNMATMLAFIATDAPMSREALRDELRAATETSFNMIAVDGDMSTNDSCYAFAPPGDGPAPAGFADALRAVTRQLAIAMVTDGEGATKTLTVNVTSARDEMQARAVARAIVNSSLVKTALHGEDPNWGRIVAAAGSVGAGIDPTSWSIYLNDKLWVDRGALEILSEAEGHTELENTSVHITLDLGMGSAKATAWGCDLSRDYVRINAHYRT
jgi:glutamate N-acetyltransferase/amino-acid N-acetyltransferase